METGTGSTDKVQFQWRQTSGEYEVWVRHSGSGKPTWPRQVFGTVVAAGDPGEEGGG